MSVTPTASTIEQFPHITADGAVCNTSGAELSSRPGSPIPESSAPQASECSSVYIARSSSAREESQTDVLTETSLLELIRQRFRRLRTVQKLLPNEDVAKCQSAIVPLATHVVGKFSPSRLSRRFHNTHTCLSPSCPNCAPRRSEVDRHKLSLALAQAEKFDIHVAMYTITARHQMGDSLAETLDALKYASELMFSGRGWASLADEYQIIGRVRIWEAHFGENGWHLHGHGLIFMRGQFSDESGDHVINWNDQLVGGMEGKMGARWMSSLASAGLDGVEQYAFSLETADSKIADYIAKYGREPLERSWGADAEIAKSPLKKSHGDGLTFFEIIDAASGAAEPLDRLARFLNTEDRVHAQNYAGALYREYFRARKGIPTIFWPKKLKDALQLEQAMKDFDEANPIEHDEISMVMFDRENWYALVKLDGRAEVLALLDDPFKLGVWLVDHRIDGEIPLAAWEYGAVACSSGPDDGQPVGGPPVAARSGADGVTPDGHTQIGAARSVCDVTSSRYEIPPTNHETAHFRQKHPVDKLSSAPVIPPIDALATSPGALGSESGAQAAPVAAPVAATEINAPGAPGARAAPINEQLPGFEHVASARRPTFF